MDKNAIKQALIELEKHHIDVAEMKYEDFLKRQPIRQN